MLKRAFSLLILLLLFPSLASSFSIQIERYNCTHIKATTDANMYVDIGFKSGGVYSDLNKICSMKKADSNGIALCEMLEGTYTYRAEVRDGVGAADAYSAEVEISTCEPETPCSSSSDCDSGEVCVGSVCVQGECAGDGDCAGNEYCQTTHTCAQVSCTCGYVEDHLCNHYECCSDANCSSGEKCVNNACITEQQAEDPVRGQANSAIKDAEKAIKDAKDDGKDVSAAEKLLTQAESKFDLGNYAEAKNLAVQAKQSAENAKAPRAGGNNGDGRDDGQAGKGFLESNSGLLCIIGIGVFFIGLIGLFIIVALVALFYKRKK